jgi:hypothetical protein
MLSGRCGSAGLTEFDFHTIMPSTENFSNRSGGWAAGFPMRTAGILRRLHQLERLREKSVTWPPRAAMWAAALGVT